MAEFDASEFIDDDFHSPQKGAAGGNPFSNYGGDADRAPTQKEVDAKVTTTQNKLAELKRAQQELERERANLEELRRRQMELTTSRGEMSENLTRGLALLEEAEFAARRDAEQMARAIAGLREALSKVEAVQQDSWTKDNLNNELTRALTTIENARMEWNAARLKFHLLDGEKKDADRPSPAPVQQFARPESYAELCKMGLALTWPVALVGLIVLVVLLVK